jgi:hypothetical protein
VTCCLYRTGGLPQLRPEGVAYSRACKPVPMRKPALQPMACWLMLCLCVDGCLCVVYDDLAVNSFLM